MANFRSTNPGVFVNVVRAVAINMTVCMTYPVYSADFPVLDEVIVTAQKQEENVNDIAITVNVVGGEALRDYSVFDFKDLEQLTAGMSLDPANGAGVRMSLRGISYDPSSNAAAAVEAYWNGMRVTFQDVFVQMFDVERIEVQKGPQGTLQGRSAPAGNVMILTRSPDLSASSLNGYIQPTWSDNSGFNTQFGVTIPLIPEKLAVRVSGVYDHSAGQELKNIVTGRKERTETKAGRITLKWMPSEKFDATFVGEALNWEDNNFGDVTGDGIYGRIGKYGRKAIADGNAHIQTRPRLATLTLNWELPGHMLTSLTGYTKHPGDRNFEDMDQSGEVPGILGSITTRSWKTRTEELRLTSTGNRFWEYMLGAYYYKRDELTVNEGDAVANGLATNLVFIPLKETEYAAFVHNTFNFTEQLRLQLGVRRQSIKRFNRSDLLAGNDFLGGAVWGGAPRGTRLAAMIGSDKVSNTQRATTGSLKILYDISDDAMVYAAYERGYRPGGVVVSTQPLTQDLLLFDKENSDSIEVGIKSTLFDRRLQVNAAIFKQKYDGHIVGLTNIGTIYGNVTFMGYNGGDAEVTGVDLETTALLTDRWSMGGSISYVDSEYASGVRIPCTGPIIPPGQQLAYCAVGGKRVGDEPRVSMTWRTAYEFPLGRLVGFTRALVKYTGSREGPTTVSVGGYTTANIYAGMREPQGNWELTLWARNVFDKNALYKAPYPPIRGSGINYMPVDIIEGRVVGLSAIYNFEM